jgi:hypothetical protein
MPNNAIHLSEGRFSFRTRRSINFKQYSSGVSEEKGASRVNAP